MGRDSVTWLAPPYKSFPSSIKIRQGLSVGALNGISMSTRPSVQELHPLVVNKLGGNRENALPSREFQYRRSQPVGLEAWIKLQASQNAHRLFRKNKTRHSNRVTSDIHQRPARKFRRIAHIFRIHVEVAEQADRRAKFSNASPAHKLLHAQPLRMRQHHERLPNLHP